MTSMSTTDDSVGRAQSRAVLGGGSEIALATVAQADREPVPHRRARRTGPRGARARRPRSCEAAGATTVDVVAFDALDFASHDGFVDDVFAAAPRLRPRAPRVRRARRPGAGRASTRTRPRRIVESNFTGAVSVLVPGRRARCARRATARSSCCRRSPASGPASRTSSTARARPGSTRSARASATASSARGVKIVVVRPGFVHTKMTDGLEPAPLATDPESVADAIVAGLGRGSETIWAPGAAALRHVGAAPRAPPGVPPPASVTRGRPPTPGRGVRLRRDAQPQGLARAVPRSSSAGAAALYRALRDPRPGARRASRSASATGTQEKERLVGALLAGRDGRDRCASAGARYATSR